MNVLILHGILGNAGENWGQWLHDSLSAKAYTVIMPSLPHAEHPNRSEWLAFIKAVVPLPTEELIIVAHSLGVTSALDYIEQSTQPVKSLVGISGVAEDYGFELNSYFLKEKSIDFQKVRARLEHVNVFYGDNDPYVTQAALKSVAANLRCRPKIIHNGGHLNAAADFVEFPVLLKSILAIS